MKPGINLSKSESTLAIADTIHYWHGKQIDNIAFCIMPNHVHWVMQLFHKNEQGEWVYLQDIMQSVKRFSANEVNKIENRKGSLWQKESFDVTIRNEHHLYRTINYTLNNPVKAGLASCWEEWMGCWCNKAYLP